MPTTRRKSVAASKARSLVKRSVGNDTLSSLPVTPKTTQHVNQAGKSSSTKTKTKTVITETVVRQSTLGDGSPRTPPRSPSLADELDPWELLPKTGYTYAQSPSYSQRYLSCDDWIVPNMSRPRIRGGASLSVISTSSGASSMGELLSVSQTNIHSHYGDHAAAETHSHQTSEMHTHQGAHTSDTHQGALQESYVGHSSTSRRKSRNTRTVGITKHLFVTDRNLEEKTAFEQSLPASVTRSGRSRDGSRRSTRLLESTSRLDSDVTDLSVEEYMQLEKQMEYSGQAGPYKESSKLSLYGLDRADEVDVSDAEMTSVKLSHAKSSHAKSHTRSSRAHSSSSFTVITSFMWYLLTTIFTICTTVVETSWVVATAPLRWLTQPTESSSEDYAYQNETETTTTTQAEAGNSQDEHSTTGILTRSRTTTANDVIDSSVQDELNVTDKYSDDEITDRVLQTSVSNSTYKIKRRSSHEYTEDTLDDDTWFTQFCYVLIAVAYMLFIAAPAGVFKAARMSSSWLFASLLLPIVDGTTTVLSAGYSVLSGSMESLRNIATTSTVTTTTTSAVNTATQHISTGYLASWYAGAGYYTNKFSMVLYTTTQMLAVLIWAPIAAVSSWVYYGVCSNWCWRLGIWIHGFAARILLLDVWILSSGRERRRGACCCLLPLLLLLLLLPFLVPVSRSILAPMTRDRYGASMLVSDKVEIPAAAGISTVALREIIAEELLAAKADLKSHGKQLYTDNQAHIILLEKQIESQGILLAHLKDCCKNDTVLAGLVRSGVQQQLAAMMLGGGSDGSSAGAAVGGSTDTGAFSNAAFVTWLNTQFAESSDFDAKIAALTVTLNEQLKEQAETNAAAMLVATQAQKVAEDANSEANKAAGLAVSMQATQGGVAGAWDNDKAHLESLIAGVAADLKNTDDKANMAAAAAATANTAAATANTAATDASTAAAAAALLLREQAESQSAAAAVVGVGTSTACGCDSQTVVLPDNYQALTENQVKLLIREALGIFGADKTGKVDYALESAGGSVISTRCSETYHRRTAQLSLFGIPLWYMSNSPRTVIQPDMQPGQCWAFKGAQGYMVIQLAGWVRPTAFSLEHIPKSLSPTGKIDSAPKDFTVWGLQYERDLDGVLLGNYTYLDNGEPLQYFPVRDPDVDAFHVVELRIHGNHGNQEYTCLYRFRVHGVLKKT